MARSAKETRLLRDVEALMESTDVDSLQKGILKLLSAYQKQARRFDKIIAQSDRQQENMLLLNEELERIKEEQDQSINNLIEDKKKRAKNVMDTKKKIYELHREEMHKVKSEVDGLTQILVQKEQIENELKELKEAYKSLKQKYNDATQKDTDTPQGSSHPVDDYDLQDVLKKLVEEHAYEQRLRKMFKSVVEELDIGQVDNLKFKKFFVSTIMKKTNEDLKKLKLKEHTDELVGFIVRKYFDDAIYFFSDHLIQQSVRKNIDASQFINFYNGEVAFLPNGKRINKPEISDLEGNRWTSSSIMQVAMRRNQELKGYKDKQNEVNDVKEQLGKKNAELRSLQEQSDQYQHIVSDVSKELNQISTSLMETKSKWMQLKQERLKASGAQAEELDKQIQELGTLVKELERNEYNFTQERDKQASELEKNDIWINQLNKEIKGYETMLNAESRKLAMLQQSQVPLEEKYQMIVSALARTIIRFQLS